MKEFARAHLNRGFEFWKRYEHRLGLGALAVGFTFDLMVAKAPDNVIDNILLCTYLFVAGALIIILNLQAMRRIERQNPTEPLMLLLILQFCFGGLASNLLVLYGKSGTLTASAIFLALLAALVFGNEYLRSRYSQLRLNVAIYYFLLLTYCIIGAPTWVFHAIGPWIFILSGSISVAIVSVFLGALFFAVLRGNRQKQIKELSFIIGIIFVAFNGFYFFNVIPPVPLSLKDIGVYHSILKHASGDYLAIYEPAPWWVFWQDTSGTFHFTPGESAYCFSSVYAPADLGTPIYHRLEEFDESRHEWRTLARISFPISGGRAEGYRGYSATAALTAGQWRCDVETASGALIGRITFTATPSSATVNLTTTTL